VQPVIPPWVVSFRLRDLSSIWRGSRGNYPLQTGNCYLGRGTVRISMM
jgi:hypothetical protein